MTRPQIENNEAAIRIYYSKAYISCKDITEIFGNMGSARMAQLRRAVRKREAELNIPIVVPRCISTKVAYEVWQIDIDELVKNRQKLIKMNMA